MKKLSVFLLSIGVAAGLAACSSSPVQETAPAVTLPFSETTPALTVDFATGESSPTALSQEEFNQLSNLAAQIKAYGQPVKMIVVGYTDVTGNAAQNKKLSLARAETVRQILADDGLMVEQIRVEGASSSHPLKNCSQEKGSAALRDCLAQNRRAEVYLLP